MKVEYYVDGSAAPNPGPGGWGCFVLTEGKFVDFRSDTNEHTTNNRMELSALIYALQDIRKRKIKNYTIYCDSAYTVNMCKSWIWSWCRNGWRNSKGKLVENSDLVSVIYTLLTEDDFSLEAIKKVKGHSTNLGNAIADALARNQPIQAEMIWMLKDHTLTVAKAKEKYYEMQEEYQKIVDILSNCGLSNPISARELNNILDKEGEANGF